jgi:hypothetical protein
MFFIFPVEYINLLHKLQYLKTYVLLCLERSGNISTLLQLTYFNIKGKVRGVFKWVVLVLVVLAIISLR